MRSCYTFLSPYIGKTSKWPTVYSCRVLNIFQASPSNTEVIEDAIYVSKINSFSYTLKTSLSVVSLETMAQFLRVKL